MRTVYMIIATFFMVILIGCGDTNYNTGGGDMSIDDHSDDHSENVEGQIATNAEINPDIDVNNDIPTDNSSTLSNENDSEISIENNEKYQQLKNDYEELLDENNRLQDDFNKLELQINNNPEIQFKDIGLSIDGNMIPINTKESVVVINNKTYYSEEFVKSLIDSNLSATIQDNTMYIGTVIKDSSNLLDEWIVNKSGVSFEHGVKDSYGNLYSNAIAFERNGKIIYNLNKEFSLIKFGLSATENSDLDFEGILTIRADNEIVYQSDPPIAKLTAPRSEVDIPIANCSLLTIEFNYEYSGGRCIMSDIVIYNP